MKTIIAILLTASALYAQQPGPAQIERLADQLGAFQFKQREDAERLLMEQTKLQPKPMVAALEKRLVIEPDSEIRNRILLSVARPIALETLAFSKDTLATKQWETLGDSPEKARYLLYGGMLEIHSLNKIEDAMAFVHRFSSRGAEEESPRYSTKAPSGPDPERLVLDVEIKVLKEHHNRKGLAGIHINIEDHRASAGLMIMEDGIFPYRHHNQPHKMDTTDGWHHYRFVVEGNRQWIFADDMETPVFELDRPKQAGRQWATFGDSTTGAGVHAQIRNVTFARYKSDAKPE